MKVFTSLICLVGVALAATIKGEKNNNHFPFGSLAKPRPPVYPFPPFYPYREDEGPEVKETPEVVRLFVSDLFKFYKSNNNKRNFFFFPFQKMTFDGRYFLGIPKSPFLDFLIKSNYFSATYNFQYLQSINFPGYLASLGIEHFFPDCLAFK